MPIDIKVIHDLKKTFKEEIKRFGAPSSYFDKNNNTFKKNKAYYYQTEYSYIIDDLDRYGMTMIKTAVDNLNKLLEKMREDTP